MFWWCVQNACIAAVLAAAVWLACRLARLSPAARHALWLVVLVKLIAPPLVVLSVRVPAGWQSLLGESSAANGSALGPAAPAAPSEALPIVASEAEANRIAWEPSPFGRGQGEGEPLDDHSSIEDSFEEGAGQSLEQLPAAGELVDDTPATAILQEGAAETAGEFSPLRSEQDESVAKSIGASPSPQPSPKGRGGREIASTAVTQVLSPLDRIQPLLFWAWLTGALSLAAVEGLRIARFRRLVARARPAPNSLQEQVARLAARLEIRTPPTLVVTRLGSPAIWPWGRAKLLWPTALVDRLPAESQRAVIVHELAHLRRRDHWTGWLELAAGCLWWFNPLLWYVRHQLRENAELACDAWVVATLPAGRRAYAEALIEVSFLASVSSAPALALGMGRAGSARKTLERRLAMIMRERVAYRLPLAGLMGIGLLCLAMLPAFSRSQDVPETTTEKPALAAPAPEAAPTPEAPRAAKALPANPPVTPAPAADPFALPHAPDQPSTAHKVPGTAPVGIAKSAPEDNPTLNISLRREKKTGETGIFVNYIPIDDAYGLETLLGEFEKERDQRPVRITADAGVPYKEVVRIVDLLGKHGIRRISLEAKQVREGTSRDLEKEMERAFTAEKSAGEDRFRRLEARLEALMAEVKTLHRDNKAFDDKMARHPELFVGKIAKDGVVTTVTPGPMVDQAAPLDKTGLFPYSPQKDFHGASDVRTLVRASYRVPTGKGEPLATFLKDFVASGVETQFIATEASSPNGVDKQEIVIVTAIPEAQAAIGQFIQLLQLEKDKTGSKLKSSQSTPRLQGSPVPIGTPEPVDEPRLTPTVVGPPSLAPPVSTPAIRSPTEPGIK